ncbi:hypothetical protein OAP03_03105 [Gammaproteobacteria bacterium]|nr:hypothetical protein [Gammaproteobacteria bacterium]
MSSNTITLIFCLGGLTFLVNWSVLMFVYFKNNSTSLINIVSLTKTLLICLAVSTFGVLMTGILFVSALMFSHG